jgi:sporulation protein YlmC with PRC-barrel domain
LLLPREPRSGLDVFRADSRCGVATAKEISYVKDARFVRFGHHFRWRPRSRRGPDDQRTVNRTLGRDLVAFDGPLVYDPSENKIGKVTDLMIDRNGNVVGAIIGVGGFLGAGQKDVVIPFKELKASTRDGKDWLVLNRTKDELKRAPAVNNTGSPSEYQGQGGDVR